MTDQQSIKFIPAPQFQGERKGYIFKKDLFGLGYYIDNKELLTIPKPYTEEWYLFQEEQKRNSVEMEGWVQPPETELEIYTNVLKNYKSRPARKQSDSSSKERVEFQHHSSDYNIWYHKKLGDRFSKESRTKATSKLNIQKDCGYTKADKMNSETYLCLYFARGHCNHGSNCLYFHRVPSINDEAKLDVNHDAFGRERHKDYREDRSGVGSIEKNNKSLYIAGFNRYKVDEEVLFKHFGQFGPIEYLKVIKDKAIAFVKYKYRACAEFAKEAMLDQSLDNDEQLIIKWAFEDPNPQSQEVERQQMFEELSLKAHEIAQTNPSLLDLNNQQDLQENPYEYGKEYVQNENINQNYYSDYTNNYSQEQSFEDSNQFSMKELETFLGNLNLLQYKDKLFANGFNNFEALKELDSISLDAMGIFDGQHKKQLLDAVAEIEISSQHKSNQNDNPYALN